MALINSDGGLHRIWIWHVSLVHVEFCSVYIFKWW